MPPKKKSMSDTGTHKASSSSLFSALGDGIDVTGFDPDSKTVSETSRFRTEDIELSKIIDNKSNNFRALDTFYLELSIAKVGQLQPIILVPEVVEGKSTGLYEIKVGSRRFAALNRLLEKAFKKSNQKDIEKYSKAFAIILPYGATQDEIETIYRETNTTARPLTVEEVFAHFDGIFKISDTGEFVHIPKGVNKYEYVSKEFKRMGFDFSATKVKEYLTIYSASDKRVTDWFEDKLLTRQQAVEVSRMPSAMQISVMDKFEQMTTKEISDYIKTYMLEKKTEKLTKKMRGIDAISFVIKSNKNLKHIAVMENIRFQSEDEKLSFLSQIQELQDHLNKIEKLLK